MPENKKKSSFLLLETIMNFLDKKVTVDKLKEDIESSKASLQNIKDSFYSDMESLDERLIEGAKREIELVNKYFDDWENAFGVLEQYLQTQEEFDLIRAGEIVKSCSEAMNFALESYLNKVLILMGPTDIPRLNLFIKTAQEIKEGASNEKLKKITADEWLMVEGAKRELEYERKIYQNTEQALLIQSYGKLQKAIEKIGHYIKDQKQEMLDEGIEDLKEIYPEIKELIPMVNYKRLSQGPTFSPAVNLLINISSSYIKGLISQEMFIKTLDETREHYQKMKMKISALASQETDSMAIKEEIEKALKGLELYESSLNTYEDFLETREVVLMEQAEKELIKSAEILNKSMESFEEMAEREGKTPCIRCGIYNLPERKTCKSCGAILPKAADMSSASTFNVQVGEKSMAFEQEETLPENLERIFLAVNQVADGKMTLEEFEKNINWLQNIMNKNKNISKKPMPKPDFANMTTEEEELVKEVESKIKEIQKFFEEGYSLWQEGLDLFREYIKEEDEELLAEGVQVMWEGNKKLNEVKNLTATFPNTQE